MAGGVAANKIARWDGSSWSPLAAGLNGSTGVRDLATFDEGNGPVLFAGGFFSGSAGTSARSIARWDGESWTPVGTDAVNLGGVRCLEVHDDGSGPALYVGGSFVSLGNVPGTNGVARWDGKIWSSVGGGIQDDFSLVLDLCSFRTDASSKLAIGGSFESIGSEPATLSLWDGASWTPLPGLVGYNPEQLFVNVVRAVGSSDNQSLLVGGRFAGTGKMESRNIARWDGAQWHGVGAGVWDVGLGNWGDVEEILAVETPNGPALLVGGYFTIADGQPQSRLALWQGCPPSCPADLNGDHLVDFADLNILLGSYNGSGPGLPGDLDGDDDVDFADLNLLLGAYNSAC